MPTPPVSATRRRNRAERWVTGVSAGMAVTAIAATAATASVLAAAPQATSTGAQASAASATGQPAGGRKAHPFLAAGQAPAPAGAQSGAVTKTTGS